MLQSEKNIRGAFWANYYNMACNTLLNVVKYINGSRLAKSGRSQKKSEIIAFIEDGGADVIRDTEAIKILLDEDTTKKYPDYRKAQIVKSLERCLPFMKNLHEYCEDKLACTPEYLALSKEEAKNVTNPERSSLYYYRNYANLFMGFVELLYEVRNYFSHYDHVEPEMPPVLWMEPNKKEKDKDENKDEAANKPQTSEPKKPSIPRLVKYLGVLFDANIRTVKQRFYSKDGVDDSPFNIFRRYKGLDENKKVKNNPDFTFDFYDLASQQLSTAGLAFLMSQFLEKAEANMALGSVGINTRFFPSLMNVLGKTATARESEELEHRIQRVFTVHSAKLPHPRVETSDMMSDQTLGLDILSYLHRCPAEIFDMISPALQENLRLEPNPNDPYQDTYFKRYESRYATLALSALDRRQSLENVRFCINMGTYNYGLHSRPVIDGTVMQDRHLSKQIYWYTTIQTAVDYYLKREGGLYYTPEEYKDAPSVYRTDMFPQYAVTNNQIALKLITRGKELPHPELDAEGKKRPQTSKPDCYLSTYELPAILFLVSLGRRDVNNVIVNYTKTWREFISKLAQADETKMAELISPDGNRYLEFKSGVRELNKMKINVADLPDQLRYYILKKEIKPVYMNDSGNGLSADQAARLWIKNQIERTDRMLENYKTGSVRDIKLGKKKKAHYDNGRLARWLLRDFMYLQKSNKQKENRFGKIKSSPDYIALEAFLRILTQNSTDVRGMFSAARLLDGLDFDHPFMNQVLQLNKPNKTWTTGKFYQTYLEKRLEWLRSDAVTSRWADNVYPLRQLEKRNNQIIHAQLPNGDVEFIQNVAQRLLDEPVNLPRGLFDSMVRDIVVPALNAANVTIPERVNTTWLIMQYNKMESKENKDRCVQGFYYWKYYFNCEPFKKLFHVLLGNPDIVGANKDKLKALQSKFIKDFDRDQLYNLLKEQVSRRAASEEKDRLLRILGDFNQTLKNIRHTMLEDISLQYAMQTLLPDIPRDELQLGQIQLKKEDPRFIAMAPLELKPSEKRNPMLNKLVQMEQFVEIPDPDDHRTLSNPKTSLGTFKIYGTMKRKNFGNFRRLVNDPRLNSLMRWYDKMGISEIDANKLMREFEEFDRIARPGMFQLVYNLEKQVITNHPLERNDEGFVPFEAIVSTAHMSMADELILIISRNAFGHQYFPEYRVRKEDQGKVTAEQLDVLNRHCNAFNEQIINEFKKNGGSLISAIWTVIQKHFETYLQNAPQVSQVTKSKRSKPYGRR